MRAYCLCVFLLMNVWVQGQDLNGIWKGTLVQAPGGCFAEYNIELQINFIPTANTFSGLAFDYRDTGKYVKMDFTGRLNSTTHRAVIIENDIQEAHIPEGCVPCIKTYDLVWSKSGNEEILSGECKGRQFGTYSACPAYRIVLKRAAKSDFGTQVTQSPDMAALQARLQLQPRSKELVKTFNIPAGEIRMDFYDNAEIDNDTITVLLNGKLLLYRQMLKAKPLTISFTAYPETEYELVMYADNLGSIPPNTALLVITAGTNKYEVRLASSEEKSAAVKFRFGKKDP